MLTSLVMALNPELQRLIASQGMSPANMVRMPTGAERAEIAKVQDMQVRTNAAGLACQWSAQHVTSTAQWLKRAKLIEGYIRGELVDDPGTTPLRGGPEAG